MVAPVQGQQAPTGPAAREEAGTMEERIEPNFEVLGKNHLSTSVRNQEMDRLMAELEGELKKPKGDLRKTRQIMGDLLGLQHAADLLDRLEAEAGRPNAAWEPVRDLMAQLWSVKRELLLELLPPLLKV
jgi:hypothetical protein